MSPISLLNVPNAMLRDASFHPQSAGPHGERTERRLSLVLVMAAVLLPILVVVSTTV